MTFIEVDDPVDMNVVTLGTSYQPATLGFAYFPSIDFEIGMDVFISDNYSDPRFVSTGSTNYDFEILLHEIYHGLGFGEIYDLENDPGEFNDLWENGINDSLKLRLMHSHIDAVMNTSSAGIQRKGRF